MNDKGLLTPEQILSVGQKLLELRTLDEVLEDVIAAAAETMHADTAMILLRSENTERVEVAKQKLSEGSAVRGIEDISSSLLDVALKFGQSKYFEIAVTDPRFSGQSSIILQNIQAAMIVPLATATKIIGAIYLDSRSDRGLFREENLGPLGTLAAFSTLAIENARRYESARKEIQTLKAGKSSGAKFSSLVGSSSVMQELFALIERVATSDLPVFISGESGTGKELVAREIHSAGARASKPFLALYCGNVAPQLFESELFGHKKGSFTGAVSDKIGLVQAVAGGTLFLDEVADIPAEMQTKLLRFLQEGEFRAVGDTKTLKADARIITATNKNLLAEVSEGRFRTDLFYRLYILPIAAPPLRDRLTDLPALVRHFLEKYGKQSGGRAKGISPDALRMLTGYAWPGNVRELENTMARALVVAQGERIEPQDIMQQTTPKQVSDDQSWKVAERKHILQVLSACSGNKSRAAEVLGISRRYLHYRLKEWGEE